jgi:serine/threonine protein kinase
VEDLLKTACGSPCYAAPEMIAGKKYAGTMTDMWSLGVILYALVCGYLPFEDANTVKLYEKIMNGRYTLPSFLSPDAKDLISRLLNTDPLQRATPAQVRKHPWYASVMRPHDPQPGTFNHACRVCQSLLRFNHACSRLSNCFIDSITHVRVCQIAL